MPQDLDGCGDCTSTKDDQEECKNGRGMRSLKEGELYG